MSRYEGIAVYILASGVNGTLYTGVTSSLGARVWQRKTGGLPGFTSRYACKSLVWCESHPDMLTAIAREKQIKHWPRQWKINLIHADNPEWRDLAEGWWEESSWDFDGAMERRLQP